MQQREPFSWRMAKSLDMSRAPGQGPGYPCLGHRVSWSGTKQLKSLDMSRAPGQGPGYPCLGHGFLGLGPSTFEDPRYV
jgi:hypothetical protein